MARKSKVWEKYRNKKGVKNVCTTGNCGGCAYFLGFLGAMVYYLQTTTGFWASVLGILKAVVWPAFVVYKLLGM